MSQTYLIGGAPNNTNLQIQRWGFLLGNSIGDGRKTTGRKGERGKGRGRRRRRLWEEEVKKEF